MRCGVRRERIMQGCILKEDGTCVCSCLKLKLLHRSCSHVMAACSECGIPPESYVSPYFRKETIAHTWQYEINQYRMVDSFTQIAQQVFYILDQSTARVKRGHRQSRRIRNDMDESDAGPRTKRYSACNEVGHVQKM